MQFQDLDHILVPFDIHMYLWTAYGFVYNKICCLPMGRASLKRLFMLCWAVLMEAIDWTVTDVSAMNLYYRWPFTYQWDSFNTCKFNSRGKIPYTFPYTAASHVLTNCGSCTLITITKAILLGHRRFISLLSALMIKSFWAKGFSLDQSERIIVSPHDCWFMMKDVSQVQLQSGALLQVWNSAYSLIWVKAKNINK